MSGLDSNISTLMSVSGSSSDNAQQEYPNSHSDVEAQFKSIKFTVLLGGSIDQKRRLAAKNGEKPRIDELEMESRYGAKILDFHWFEQQAQERFLPRLLLGLAMRTGQRSMLLAVQVLKSIKKDDVIYATGEDVGLPLAAMLRLLRRKRPHIVMRLEQPIYGRTPSRRALSRWLFRFSVKRIDLILCRTTAHINFLNKSFGLQPDMMVRLPETIDNKFFNQTQPVDEQNLKVVPPVPFVFSAGLEMRDYATLLKAVKDLPLQVVIAAGSPWSKFRFDESMKTPDNVTVRSFSPGEMRELYRSADLVVVPVRQTMRSCGITVVLEAWAMERPVIASGTQGLSDYVQNSETGLLVTPENASALYSAIQALSSQPEKASQLARNGHQRVVEELNMDRYVARVGGIVCDLMNRSR